MSYQPDFDVGIEWGPLEAVAKLLTQGDRGFELSRFMYMCCMVNEEGKQIFLYKHSDTRRYLNLDASGHAYRYLVKFVEDEVIDDYEPFSSLLDASEDAHLWSDPDFRSWRRSRKDLPSA